ncbi:MAG: sterol desaturase family protein [Nitrospirae bacterium]|nr:sterol desaturase family protein [Nitrospirota bacterium]
MYTKPIIIIAVLVLIFILEGFIPYLQGRRLRLRHGLPHVLTAVLNGLLTRFFLAGITMQVTGWAQAHSLGLARMGELPGAARMIAVFLLFDIWMYYWHMATHRFSFFWRFHRAHHSDIEMDTTTALRFHPGELVLSSFIRLPVLVLIGMSFGELVLFEVMLNISTLFHHSNLDLPEKWDRLLRVLIATPNMHRVHHSVERDETNSNYTSILSLWDRLAGTFRMREDTRTITLGLQSFREEKYQRLGGFLITPFQ